MTKLGNPTGGAPWHAAAVLAAGLAAAFQVGKGPVATSSLQADLSISLAAAGALTGVLALVGLVCSLPAGAAAAAGDRRLLLWGLGVIAAASGVGALASTFEALLLARAGEGAGVALVLVAGPALLDRVVTDDRRPMALALWSCVMPLGIAAALLSGPLLSGWRLFWWTGAGLALGAALSVLRVPPTAGRPRDSGAELVSGVARLAARQGPLLLSGIFALYSLSFFALFSFMPVLLTRLGVGGAAASLYSGVAAAANIVGNLAAPRLLSRSSSPTVVLAAASVAMGLAGLGIFLPLFGDGARVGLCVLFSAVGGAIPATLLAAARNVAPPALAAGVFGLLMLGSNLGQALGPVAIGGLVDRWGWSAAAAAVGAAAGLAALAALGVRHTPPPAGAGPAGRRDDP